MSEALLPLVAQPGDVQSVLGRDEVLVVDVNAPEKFEAAHLPGAVNLDYAQLVHKEPPAMGLMPDTATLSEVLSGIGLLPEHHIIAYDSEGSGRASRLIWTLHALGHWQTSLLDGGLPAWQAEGLPTESGPVETTPSSYRAELRNPEVVADKDYISTHLDDSGVVVLDARSAGEYEGSDRRAARGGHIPGAVNLDWLEAMDHQHHRRLKPADELRTLFESRGLRSDQEVITHCQTHHRSSLLYVALRHLGYPRVSGYPGSWSEWGNDPELPVATGED